MEQTIVENAINVRKKHKKMGARVMYHNLRTDVVGINKFENILSKNGLNVRIRKRRVVTTKGIYEENDKNLINGLTLNGINQVIAGDITYLTFKDKNYYIFTLKDMYSKRIIGLFGSDNMLAINAVKTLKQAIKLRGDDIRYCIHHSDAGSQYKSKIYKRALKSKNIFMSIAENCLQNGMAEQLNGVIKNDYLNKEFKNVRDLNRQLREIVRLINHERPVKELGYKTPCEFEKWLEVSKKYPEIKLYDFTNQNSGTLERHNNKKSIIY